MTWKAKTLSELASNKIFNKDSREAWERDSRGLTLDDYLIWVRLVGHTNFRSYHYSHQRDVDITTKQDVWKALREVQDE